MISRRIFIFAGALAFSGLAGSIAACKSETTPVAGREADAPLEYIERVTGGADAASALPMIVVLHGLGGSPQNICQVFDGFEGRARVICLRGPDPFRLGSSWFTIDASRGERGLRAGDIAKAAARVDARVRELVQARPTVGKPVVTGFSQGGMLSFAIAVKYGDTFARAIPIAGWIPSGLLPSEAEAKAAMPIFALHGTDDEVVSFPETEALVKELARRGVRVELVSEAGVRHQIGPKMREALFADLKAAIAAPAVK